MNKRTFMIIKWCVQILLASLLSYLIGIHFIGGATGDIIVGMLKILPFPIVVGVVLGDISLYKGQKFSFLAVFVALLLGPVGVVLSLYVRDFLEFCSKWGPIFIPFWMLAIPLPSLIGYNLVSMAIRKLGPKHSGSQADWLW